jgi:hypothetical protein
MSTDAKQVLSAQRQAIQDRGNELVGMLVSVSVADCKIPYGRLRDAIVNDPSLDGSWLPDRRDPVTCYLDAMRDMGAKSGFTFNKDVHGISDDQHEGYTTKISAPRNRKSQIVSQHKVFHCTRKTIKTENEDGGVKTQSVLLMDDVGIDVRLVRLTGDDKSDKTGGSTFEIQASGVSGKPSYLPFLERLTTTFNEMLADEYNASQITSLLRTLVRDRLHAQSINGWYFTFMNELERLAALETVLREVSENINFVTVPIEKPSDLTAPEAKTFTSVSKGVTESLMSDINALVKTIEGFKNSDAKTRASTWTKRLDDVNELKDRVETYKATALITSDSLDEMLEEAIGAIKAEMNKGDDN